MRNFFQNLVASFFKLLFWFRYRITVKGLDNLNSDVLKEKGGVLFLPNHPTVFIDPTIVTMSAWKRYPIRPIIVEYMYYAPVIHTLMSFMKALPIPNNEVSSNPLKRKRSEKTLTEVTKGLQRGENFLIYPAGKLKNNKYEILGGASGVHRILKEAPDANVVLVRTTGLWGSSFSKAYLGVTPPMFPTIWQGIKFALKNGLFFLPRREVTVEFFPAPKDFPYKASRMELNKYLENWYNTPDGLSETNDPCPGETLNLVSYSRWKDLYLEPRTAPEDEFSFDPGLVPDAVRDKVLTKLSELTGQPMSLIDYDMNISTDLGLDSLDTAELVVFLEDQFDVKGVQVKELTTVAKMLALASKQLIIPEEAEHEPSIKKWFKPIKAKRTDIAPGKTIPEVFLNNCERMGNAIACGDTRTGALTYPQFKMRVILLAEYVKKLPGDHVGILLPASVAASALILACQLAGKIPVLVNWTAGPRHLESVVKFSNLKVILTSWAFTDRLVNVDLSSVDDLLIMLEDARREFTLRKKLQAFWRSKKGTTSLLKLFGSQDLKENDRAVLIFTSGTESLPKGVPLSHRNILSNQRGVFEAIDLYTNDVLFGILPPFHAFGLTISCLIGLLSGVRVAFSPDPTDGKRLAQGLQKWGITIVCGAPTFIRKMLKSATTEQIKTLRFVVTGAEKAPPELFTLLEQFGITKKFFEGYGITECSPVLTINRPGTPAKGVGQAMPEVELCIVHPDTHELLGLGQQGLILARGPNVFAGYINPGISSPFTTVDGKQWYVTGDLGSLDENGYLIISGRQKRFIKLGGEMISLAAIEEALLQMAPKKGWQLEEEAPSLAVCAKEIAGDKPKIYLFTRFKTDVDEVNQTLKEAGFTNLVKVTSVHVLEEIPLMGSGKVHYRELDATYLNDKAKK